MTLLLSCQNLTKSFGAQTLFHNITLGISQGDRIGLIGPNGAGKSTFLKILAGMEPNDEGEVILSQDTKMAYLSQDTNFQEKKAIEETVLESLQFEPLEDYEKLTDVHVTLGQVGFTETQIPVQHLSGGWRKRLALACELVKHPNLIFLDEPTNHLDLETVLWLEKFLQNSHFAYVLISHDRAFLENTTNRILEINPRYPKGYFTTPGNYSKFLEKREEFFQSQKSLAQSLSSKVRRETEWLKRGAKARTTKANFRIQQAHELSQELQELKTRSQIHNKPEISFTTNERQTKKLIEVKNITKSFGEKKLFSHVSFLLSPKMSLGLIGPNGSGKTTLLKILNQELSPDTGSIRYADHLKIAYFDQERVQLNLNQSLKEALSPTGGDFVIYRGRSVHVSSWAKRFQFRIDQLPVSLRVLSGGERARVLIAQFMLKEADVLILDEPTNDLDIETLEVLEESLLEFPGAVVLVSHDRFFLDQVSTHILALTPGEKSNFYADYWQWEADQKRQEKEKIKQEKKTSDQKKTPLPKEKQKTTPKKLSYKEQREYDMMEEKILSLESEIEEYQKQTQSVEIINNAEKLDEICQKLQKAQDEVDQLYARWAELEEKLKLLASSPESMG